MIDETSQPLVSCIMPTYNRRKFVPLGIRYFLRQDYEPKELIIVDDGTDVIDDLIPADERIRYFRLNDKSTVGAKRNLACEQARGEIIAHWDDDDWMATHRISYQLGNLLREQADICGLDKLYFYDPLSQKAWQYVYPKRAKPWVAGGTLCYSKSFWSQNLFPEINIGEDGLFVWSSSPKKIVALEDSTFFVALMHEKNISPKQTSNRLWHAQPLNQIQKIMGKDWSVYEYFDSDTPKGLHYLGSLEDRTIMKKQAVHNGNGKPKVSCILPTYNRRGYFPQAIQYFLRQDYSEKQLIVLDDGTDRVADLVPDISDIEYIQIERRLTIGEKRNIGVEACEGDIVLLWDDDDWYGANRISYQVAPIIEENADATVLQDGLVYDVIQGQFFHCRSLLRDQMFAFGVIGGTIAFRKDILDNTICFPKQSLAEDAEFLRLLYRQKFRVIKMPAKGVFVYIRHNQNTWTFSNIQKLHNQNWQRVDPPSFISSEDLHFYNFNCETTQNQCPTEPSYQAYAHQKKNQQDSNVPLSVQGARLYWEGAYNEALDCLEKAARIESDNPWILFDMGLCYLAQNRFNGALSLLQSAHSKIPSNTWVLSSIGIAFARLGDYEKARESFLHARQKFIKNHEAALFLDGLSETNIIEGIREFEQGKYYSALNYLDAALMKDPQKDLAFYYKGKILMELGKPFEALPYYLSANHLNPNQACILKGIGEVLTALGHSEQAKIFFNKPQVADSKGHKVEKISKYFAQGKKSFKYSYGGDQLQENPIA
jgi:glycosyltransferase involved in cell wall biosynthesis/Tfp pilus assembly protein PilF